MILREIALCSGAEIFEGSGGKVAREKKERKLAKACVRGSLKFQCSMRCKKKKEVTKRGVRHGRTTMWLYEK